MHSNNSTINRVHYLIQERIERLRTKKQNLREKIDEKYPEDIYGIKGVMIYEEQSKKLDDEITLLRKYDSGIYDLIEIIEGKA